MASQQSAAERHGTRTVSGQVLRSRSGTGCDRSRGFGLRGRTLPSNDPDTSEVLR